MFNIWICILDYVLFLTVTICNLFLGEYTGEITFILTKHLINNKKSGFWLFSTAQFFMNGSLELLRGERWRTRARHLRNLLENITATWPCPDWINRTNQRSGWAGPGPCKHSRGYKMLLFHYCPTALIIRKCLPHRASGAGQSAGQT